MCRGLPLIVLMHGINRFRVLLLPIALGKKKKRGETDVLGSPFRAFLMLAALAAACLLAGVLFRNHIAIRTVAAYLNHDLAKLVNGEVAGQLWRER